MPTRPLRPLLAALLLVIVIAPAARAELPLDPPPDPAALGRFAVGHVHLDLVDATRGDRSVPTEVWYPADPAAATGPLSFYLFGVFSLGLQSHVAHDGAAAADGVRPLVVFSHGSGGINVQSTALMEGLASHGFVVAAPNHTGNTAIDTFFGTSVPFSESAVDRPNDVRFVIDEIAAFAADPASPIHGRVDTQNVGVAGHSFGGFTALAVAGGVAAVPADPRVRAIVPIAPASDLLPDATLTAIHVPVLILGGSLDTTTPIVTNSTRPYALVPGRPLDRVDIYGATHLHFSNVCDLQDALIAGGSPPNFIKRFVPEFDDACGPAALPIREVQRLQNLYAVSFLRLILLKDVRYAPYLEPPYSKAEEPGLRFFRRPAPLSFWREIWFDLFFGRATRTW